MQTDFGNPWHLFIIIMKYNAQNVLSDTVTDYILLCRQRFSMF